MLWTFQLKTLRFRAKLLSRTSMRVDSTCLKFQKKTTRAQRIYRPRYFFRDIFLSAIWVLHPRRAPRYFFPRYFFKRNRVYLRYRASRLDRLSRGLDCCVCVASSVASNVASSVASSVASNVARIVVSIVAGIVASSVASNVARNVCALLQAVLQAVLQAMLQGL